MTALARLEAVAHDLAVVVPLEVLVCPFEALAVRFEVRRTLGPRVRVGEVAQPAGLDVHDLEDLAVDLEDVARRGVLVATVELGHGAVGHQPFEVFVREQLARFDACHARGRGRSRKRRSPSRTSALGECVDFGGVRGGDGDDGSGNAGDSEDAADGSGERAFEARDERDDDTDDDDASAEDAAERAETETRAPESDDETETDREDDAADGAGEQSVPRAASEAATGDVARRPAADETRDERADSHGSTDDADHEVDQKPDADRAPVGHASSSRRGTKSVSAGGVGGRGPLEADERAFTSVCSTGSMIFEELPTTPTAEELTDRAFSRAARTGRAKSGVEAQRSMLQTAANVLSDNLEHVVTSWPDFSTIDPFYYELADAIVEVDELRKSLSEVGWASRKTGEIKSEYQGRLRGDVETARKLRKQAFARLADVVEDLDRLGDARDELRVLPDIRPDEPTIVVAGFPNVGKSTFVNRVTNARHEIAAYPFTTTRVGVGHLTREHIRYQLVDTPGLLDREGTQNAIEVQAESALTHVADCVLVFVDASESCGYPLEDQLALRDALVERFDVPVRTVCTKADRSRDIAAECYLSVEHEEGIEELVEMAIDAVGYEPELP